MSQAAGPLDATVFESLRESVGGDDAFVVDLVETYLADAATQIGAIDRAIGAADADALVRPAHTLKTGSLTIGATRLGELSRGLEMSARDGNLDGAPEAAVAIRDEWARLEPVLRAWVEDRAAS